MTADWEIGSEDEWFLECQIPSKIFTALAHDLTEGRCRKLDLDLELNPTLVDDEHAPPGVPVTLGVLQRGSDVGGSVDGWLVGLSWRVVTKAHSPDAGKRAGRKRRALSARPRSAPSLSTSEPAAMNSGDLSQQVVELARATRRGFLLVLALLAVLAILR